MTTRLFFLLALTTLAVGVTKAQSPGGVSAGLKLWVKANDAALAATADNSSLAIWTDRSGNSYNLTQVSSGNQPRYRTNAANLVNFNPSIIFTSANNQYMSNTGSLLGGAATGYHIMAVAKSTANSFNTDGTLRGIFNLGANNGSPSLDFQKDGNANNAFNPFVTTGTATGESNTPTTGNATIYNGGGVLRNTTINIPGGAGSVRINNQQPQIFGLSQATGSSTLSCYTDGYTWSNDRSASAAAFNAARFQVGTGFGAGGSCWQGTINEVIAYSTPLTGNALKQVNSYLAIKYGITLGQGNNTSLAVYNAGNNAAGLNYLFSDGATDMWTPASNTGYTYDIAGIVRDANSGLNQKQSQSVNAGSMVTLGLGTIAASNTGNPNTISADNSAFVWAANMGGVGTMVANTNYTTGADGINAILSKRWKVQLTGTGFTGSTIRVAVAVNNGIVSSSAKLIVSTTGAFNNASEVKYNLTSSGGYLYADVPVSVLGNGTYFTFGDVTKTPGGVGLNLVAWFKADAGVNATINGAAATDGSNASQWLNQVANAPMYEVNNMGTNNGVGGPGGPVTAPLYNTTTKLVNYNPSVVFNGSNVYGLYNYNAVYPLNSAGTATGFHLIGVARDEGPITGLHSIAGNGQAGNFPGLDFQQDGASFNGLNFFTGCSGEWNGGGATIYNGGGIGANALANIPAGYTNQINNRQPRLLVQQLPG